jgi:hypothetical protein
MARSEGIQGWPPAPQALDCFRFTVCNGGDVAGRWLRQGTVCIALVEEGSSPAEDDEVEALGDAAHCCRIGVSPGRLIQQPKARAPDELSRLVPFGSTSSTNRGCCLMP